MKVAICGAGIAGLTLAWWLSRAGHDVVVFERAPRLRTGGYMLDFFRSGWEVAERMGLLPALAKIHFPIPDPANGVARRRDVGPRERGLQLHRPMDANVSIGQSIEALNSFLFREVSAAETYSKVLQGAARDGVEHTLVSCKQSHERRAALLRERIGMLCGHPTDAYLLWGPFAKSPSAAASLELQTLCCALAEGESKTALEHQAELCALDARSQRFVATHILSEQVQTRRAMLSLTRAPERQA